MGGNAFAETKRLTPKDVDRYIQLLSKVFNSLDIHWAQPPELLEKTSFGDVDLIITLPEGDHEIRKQVLSKVSEVLECPQPPTAQFNFLSSKLHQIDILQVSSSVELANAVAVTSHGDLMWLLHKMITPFGLVYSKEGLYFKSFPNKLKLSSKNTKLRLYLSSDRDKIAKFLGIDPTVFDGKTRFSSSQVFEIVVNSRFFDPKRIMEWYEKMKDGFCQNRDNVRCFKRPMLANFISYLNRNQEKILPSTMDPMRNLPISNQQRLLYIFEWTISFFEVESRLDQLRSELAEQDSIKNIQKECRKYQRSKLLRGSLKELNGCQFGEMLVKMRGQHGNSPLEYLTWLKQQSDDELIREAKSITVTQVQ